MCIRDRNKGAYVHPFTSKKHVKPYNANVQNINTNNNHINKNNCENKIVQQPIHPSTSKEEGGDRRTPIDKKTV